MRPAPVSKAGGRMTAPSNVGSAHARLYHLNEV